MATVIDTERFTQDQLTRARANDFCRWVSALDAANNSPYFAAKNFELRWPRSTHVDLVQKAVVELHTKAGVDPGTTTAVSWAAPLAALKPLSDAFIAIARPVSLLGKLEPLVARVPFDTAVPTQTGGSSYQWIGQTWVKPLSDMRFKSVALTIAKAAGQIVVTQELIALAQPASVIALRRELVNGLTEFLDRQLVDPAVAAVANTSPGSITNQAPSIGSVDPASDVTNLLAAFFASNGDAASCVLLTSPSNAAAIATATGSTTLGIDGGTVCGARTFTSVACGNRLIALDPASLLVADDGDISVSASKNAIVEMSTSTSSPPVAGTVQVSCWQLGLVAVLCERFLNFQMARANACVYTNTSY